jgi:hypothetical protein
LLVLLLLPLLPPPPLPLSPSSFGGGQFFYWRANFTNEARAERPSLAAPDRWRPSPAAAPEARPRSTRQARGETNGDEEPLEISEFYINFQLVRGRASGERQPANKSGQARRPEQTSELPLA